MICALYLFDRGLVRSGHGRVHLAEADAPVLQVEHQVGAGCELAGLGLLDRLVHAVVDALDGARSGRASREGVLVDVDADAPPWPRRPPSGSPMPHPPATWKTTWEPCGDLVLGHGLALVLGAEVLRVADRPSLPGLLLGALPVARDPDVDRRDLETADGADGLRAHRLRRARSEDPARQPPSFAA